jgi:hypothetical protein
LITLSVAERNSNESLGENVQLLSSDLLQDVPRTRVEDEKERLLCKEVHLALGSSGADVVAGRGVVLFLEVDVLRLGGFGPGRD